MKFFLKGEREYCENNNIFIFNIHGFFPVKWRIVRLDDAFKAIDKIVSSVFSYM